MKYKTQKTILRECWRKFQADNDFSSYFNQTDSVQGRRELHLTNL